MNCKFKFHLRAAIHRGTAGPVGSAEVGGPAGGPELDGRCPAGGAPPDWLRRCRAGGLRLRVGCVLLFCASPGFALENRVLWFCGQAGANRAGLRAAFRLKRDARKAPSASVHLFPLLFFQKERIDDEFTLSPRRRQSNVFFAENAPIKIKVRNKITYFHSVFLLLRPHLALSLGHLALIYPAAAWKLTTKPRGRGFRRQFPSLLRDRSKLEVFHEYLYGGSQQRFRSNSYS